LIAGPILYHKDMIPQFTRIRNFVFSHKNMALGISMFSIGLFKKVVIADNLSPWVKTVFDNADKVSFAEAWAGAVAYTLQLYFDFSGYSEMAIGLGLMFNLSLPVNFNAPYLASSIIDFWRRWHITLSTFLKNYLYIPLGGNRGGDYMRMRNIMITMLLGGLWHGAGWTFVLWGGLHGVYLVINHVWRKTRIVLPTGVAWFITFIGIVVAWVFFRAHSISDAFAIVQAMMGLQYSPMLQDIFQLSLIGKKALLVIGAVFLMLFLPDPQALLQKLRPNFQWAALVMTLLVGSLFNLGQTSEFLYFQF
jgi:alginate O-acetyltransferase complex protein AlgI